ncbi:MAG: hypothetical protein B7Z74_07865, partial [Deltaproteobacteria bacterium 21-66-5]
MLDEAGELRPDASGDAPCGEAYIRRASTARADERTTELTRATDPVLILIFRGTHQVLSAEKR